MRTLTILHRDALLVVVDKPSGLLVHRGWGQDREILVEMLVHQLGQKVYPVHRLDRATSGVIVLALDSPTAASLQSQFEAGRVGKTYLALVRGRPPADGVIDHPIPRREDGPRVPALTRFRTLQSVGHLSLVEARPETGRLHQIRRHLKHISHPLIGDANYGKGKLNRELRAQFGIARLALHARSLELDHPQTGERLRCEAPLPPDLAEPLGRMGFDLSEMANPA